MTLIYYAHVFEFSVEYCDVFAAQQVHIRYCETFLKLLVVDVTWIVFGSLPDLSMLDILDLLPKPQSEMDCWMSCTSIDWRACNYRAVAASSNRPIMAQIKFGLQQDILVLGTRIPFNQWLWIIFGEAITCISSSEHPMRALRTIHQECARCL